MYPYYVFYAHYILNEILTPVCCCCVCASLGVQTIQVLEYCLESIAVESRIALIRNTGPWESVLFVVLILVTYLVISFMD